VDHKFISLQVFPNPVSTHVTLSGISPKIKELSISNQLGQRIFSAINIHTTPYRISVHEWKAGIYYIHLLFENGSAENHKLIRQ